MRLFEIQGKYTIYTYDIPGCLLVNLYRILTQVAPEKSERLPSYHMKWAHHLMFLGLSLFHGLKYGGHHLLILLMILPYQFFGLFFMRVSQVFCLLKIISQVSVREIVREKRTRVAIISPHSILTSTDLFCIFVRIIN